MSRFSNILFAVADPDFQIRGGGGGAGHPGPSDKGGLVIQTLR